MALITARLAEKEYGFDVTDADGHTMRIDIPVAQGGNGSGFRPMQMLLSALCGCSAVDVISILKKQRRVLKTSSLRWMVKEKKEKSLLFGKTSSWFLTLPERLIHQKPSGQ